MSPTSYVDTSPDSLTGLDMAGVATGQRVLTTGWGCEDQQFVHGDCSESTDPNCQEGGGYKAKDFPLKRFYDR